MSEVTITGLDETMAKLDELAGNVARKHTRKALSVAADVFVTAAKDHAPILAEASTRRIPGELRDAIDKFPYKRDGAMGFHVGPGYDKAAAEESPGVWGMFEEFGIGHSAGKGHPYLRPAFDGNAEDAVAVFAETLKQEAGLS